MKMREFTKDDWNGFSGCETYTDANGTTHQPLINEHDEKYLIIVDANFISVFYGDDYMTDEYYEMPYFKGKQLAESMTAAELVKKLRHGDTWRCRCGHEVVADDRPEPIRWTDGHTCYFY